MIIKVVIGFGLLIVLFGPWFRGTSYAQWFLSDSHLGYWYFSKRDYAKAAEAYRDPFAKGVAFYRAGDFKSAAAVFGEVSSADGYYNRGNALLMQGSYDLAIESYQRALEERPDWGVAKTNLSIAIARKERLKQEGGEGTDGKLGADDIVFDQSKNKSDQQKQQTEQIDGGELTEAEKQAMWLRKVQTQPGQYLKMKFQFQAHNLDSEAME